MQINSIYHVCNKYVVPQHILEDDDNSHDFYMVPVTDTFFPNILKQLWILFVIFLYYKNASSRFTSTCANCQ